MIRKLRKPSAFDPSTLLAEAVRLSTKDASGGLAQIFALTARLPGVGVGALYARFDKDGLHLSAGQDDPELRAAAQACLHNDVRTDGANPMQVIRLEASGETVGAWAFCQNSEPLPDDWRHAADVLANVLAIGLRRERWRSDFLVAQTQIERRIREVATVYEIGQAVDEVEIDRLLELVTRRAAAVMDAQACSLMLKPPESPTMFIAASFGLADDIVANTRILIGERIAGHVAQTGEPLLLNSLMDDGRFGSEVGVPGIASSICMPMKDENGLVSGVLCIRRAQAPPFADEDVRLFSIFASQAALAINNAKLYARLNNKINEMSTVAALTEAIISTLDLDQVLSQIADSIVHTVHFDRCRIYLADMETGRFSARIVRGFRWRPDTEYAMGEGLIGLSAQRQTPIQMDSLEDASLMLREYAESLGIESFNAQPIVARGRCIGVIVVSNSGPQRPMDAQAIELLRLFVDQAGIAIENARIHAGRERRYAELATLYDVSKTLAATSGVQKAAETINDLATRITDSDAGLLLLLENNKEAMTALHARGVSEALANRLRSFAVPVPVSAWARDLREPRLLVADDVEILFGPDWQPVCEAFLARHRAAALVPLVVDESAIGFLLLGKRGSDYGGEELKLIAVASSQAAAVLASASTYERRQTLRDMELSAVYELMQKVRTAMTLDDALSSILDILANLVWSDESALLMVDEGGQTMTVRAARGTQAGRRMGQSAPLGDSSLPARALRGRNALIESDLSSGASQMAIPLLVGDEMIGALFMESRTPDTYSEESVMMLSLVASQAATIYREISQFRFLTRSTENILRSIAAGVITIDKNGKIATWSAQAEQILFLKSEQILGQHYRELVQRLDESEREDTMAMLEEIAQTGKTLRLQICRQSPQGEEMFVNLSASQLKSEADEFLGIVIVLEDVTNEVQLKQEIAQANRLAETGQLAANIAHELGNPLASIKGAAQLIRNELPPDISEQSREFLDIIIEEANGLKRMTAEFLAFSRVTPPEMHPTDLNAVISRLLHFMSAYLDGEDVSVHLTLDERLPDVTIDKAQIEQVLKNIIINAAQAMPHGGTLTAATSYYPIQDIIEISLTDTGVGIPADKMEKIWTPFYTSKTKGTGLGLAIARKIVETHGGNLLARSTPGSGTTFTMHLPTHPAHIGPMPSARLEITDQRSDRAGTVFEIPASYSDDY